MDTTPWMIVLMLVMMLAAGAMAGMMLYQTATPDTTERYVEYPTTDFGGDAAFTLQSPIQNEILRPRRNWLINGNMAEVEYDISPGKSARLRTAASGTPLVPEPYQSAAYQNTGTVTVDDIPVQVSSSPGGPALATWTRDGFDYALLMPDPEMNMLGGILNEFVPQAKAEFR